MSATETEQPEPEVIGEEARRSVIELVALDGLTVVADKTDDERVEFLDYVLRAICIELAETSLTHEQETAPAVKVLGQLVGGLFGAGSTATDETLVGCYKAGANLREHISQQIGWPEGVYSPATLDDDEAVTS